ncbi:hypothetical protein QJQ45_012465 [Haematococcus lacustris]|nr:hypothetical protein QJQ45_012465 [Haematococcus lacustris]
MADPSLEVRAAEPSDLPDIHSSVFASGRAAVLPLFQAVFRKGWDMYLRATGLAVLVLVFFVLHPEWQTNGLQLLGLAVLCFSAVFFLTLVFIWTQMEKESGRSVAGDLSHVHGSSSGKSHCWVVTRPHQPEGKVNGSNAQFVACAWLKFNSSVEGELLHLYVKPTDQNRGLASTLLKHVIKYAVQHGLKRIIARCHNGQAAALHVLDKAGFRQQQLIKLQPWFSVHKMNLDLRKLQ